MSDKEVKKHVNSAHDAKSKPKPKSRRTKVKAKAKKVKSKSTSKVTKTKSKVKKSNLKKVNPRTLKTKKRNKSTQTKAHTSDSNTHKEDVMDEIFRKKDDRSTAAKKTSAGVSAAKKKAKTAGQKSTYQRRTRKDTRKKKKAEYLATLPKSPTKRALHRISPKRALKYIFSKRGLFMFMKLSAAGVIFLVILVAAVFAYFRRDLDILDVERRRQDQTTVFYDRTGNTVLYELYGNENRKVVEFEDISQYVKDATIAIEDKDFYDHSGFSARGIIRATVNNAFGGSDGELQGGSTITQQFIKNSLLTNERKITRKIKELILSIELERLFSKDEILEMYLNEVAYGGQSYGIEAASITYFDKSAANLTLDEAALLAALPQQPGNFNPYAGALADQLPVRQKQVLQNMLDLTDRFDGRYTKEMIEKAMEVDTLAKLVPLEDQNQLAEAKAPHFVLEVKKQLDAKYGEQAVASGGLKVITTIDLELQDIAEKAVSENIYLVDNAGGNNAALSSSNSKTGEILAMVGSRDYNYDGFGSFNAATALRQPGSSYKPYAYATLFKSPEWGPGSVIYDVKTDFGGGYSPDNYCRCFSGANSIRRSLGQSLNIPAVKAGYIAGIDNVIDQAAAMGADVIDQEYYGLGSPLGSNEIRLVDHVAGYSTFANSGIKNDPVYVLEITNPKGEVIEKWEPEAGERVLDEQISYLISDMLSDIGNALSPSYFIPGLQHTVKTGTTDDAKDGWMMGYSGCLTTGVWMGHNDNVGLATDFTGSVAGFLWRQYMTNAHNTLGGKDCGLQAQPAGIKTVTLDRVTGKIPSASTKNGTVTDKFPSWYKAAAEIKTEARVYDTISGLLATECTPEAAKAKYSTGGISPEIPPTDPSYNAWLSPIAALAGRLGVPLGGNADSVKKDDVHKCSDTKPSVSLTLEEVNDKTYKITVDYTKGTHPLESVSVSTGGSTIRTFDVSSSGSKTFNYSFTSYGSKTVTASIKDEVLYTGSDSETAVLAAQVTVSPIVVNPSSDITLVSWSSEPTAASYRVCVDTSNPPATCFEPAGSATTYSPAGLTAPGYVFVEALDQNGDVITGSTSPVVQLN